MAATQHYEKIITLCCFLIMFCNVGLPSTSFSVYQPYIVAIPGVGDTGGSIVIGTRTLVSLICMVFVGRFYARFDVRKGCFIAALCTTAGLVVFGFAHSLPALCLAAAIAGAGYGLGGMIGCTLLINRWFKTDVGTAMGITAVGSGVASILIPIAAENIITAWGLFTSFWMEAALAIILALVILTLLRNRPEDLGLKPYVNPRAMAELDGGTGETKPGATDAQPADTGVHLPKHAYHLFLLAMAFIGACCVAGPTFISVLFVSEGYDSTFGALMISTLGIVLTISKFLTGRIFDKLGAVRGTFISQGAMIAGMVLLCLSATGNAVLAVAGTALVGWGTAVATVGIPIWSLHLSTPDERADIIRKFQVAYALGSFLYNLMPGLLKDLTGTYVVPYAIMGVMALVALLIIVSVYTRYHDKQAPADMRTQATGA